MTWLALWIATIRGINPGGGNIAVVSRVSCSLGAEGGIPLVRLESQLNQYVTWVVYSGVIEVGIKVECSSRVS